MTTGITSKWAKYGVDRPLEHRLSKYRSLLMAKVEPDLMELASAGVLYGYNNGSANGLANVSGVPTTTATYGIYNASTSKSVVVLKIAVFCTTITAPLDFALIAGLPDAPQASAETKYSGSLALPINPGQQDAEAYLTDGVTLAATPLWQTFAHYGGGTGLIGSSAVAWVNGMYIIPPKYCLGIDIIGDAGTTPLYDVDVLAMEIDLND